MVDSQSMLSTLIIKVPQSFAGDPSMIEGILSTLHNTMDHKRFCFQANVMARKLFFCIRCRKDDVPIIENHLYTTFEDIEVDHYDFPLQFDVKKTAKGELRLKERDYFPIKTYAESSISYFIKFLSQTADLSPTEKLSFQVLLQPANTHNIFFQFWRRIKFMLYMFFKFFDFKQRWFDTKINVRTTQARASFQKKNHADLFYGKFRFFLQSDSQNLARAKTYALFKNFSDIESHQNAFKFHIVPATKDDLIKQDTNTFASPKYLLHPSEIATMYHFPSSKDRMPHVLRVLSKKAPPPLDLPTPDNTAPKDLVAFAVTNYRSLKIPFGVKTADKARHMYLVGKSGSGKSKMLELLCKSDIDNGRGFALLDPHGDVVDAVLARVPASRKQDVIVFDPTDL